MFASATYGSIGGDRRYGGGIWYDFGSSSALQAVSSRCRRNFRDANEVVGSGGQHEEPFHQATATMSRLAQASDSLHPSERLFDPLALDCADAIAGVSGRACIDRRAAIGIVLRDMRRAAAFTAACDEVGGVIVLVAAHRAAGLGVVLDHVERSRALRRAVGLGQSRIDDEPVAVLRHQMPHVTELGLLAGAFAEQPGVGIGRRRMRIIPALLAVKVALGIAPTAAAAALSRGGIAAIPRHKALHAGPSLDQRAVDRE